MGFMATFLIAIAGAPAYLILVFVFGPPLSGWLILPFGIATLAILQWIGSLKNTSLPKEPVGDPVNTIRQRDRA
jgi:hypothetical protein